MSDVLDEAGDTLGEVGKKFNKKTLLIISAGVVGVVLFLRWRNPVATTSAADTSPAALTGGSVGGSTDLTPVVDAIGSAIGQSNQSIISAITDSNSSMVDTLQSGLLSVTTPTAESNILARDMTSAGQVIDHATATLPGGAKIAVDMVNGKTQTNLPVGTIVDTGGGDYKITGGSPGEYTSTPVKANTSTPKTTAAKTTAITPTGKAVPVTVVNGKTQTTVPVGTVVKTNGGSFKVTGGTPGHYTSTKVS